jgi:E3 ubiquitin-protein ligase HUWE1
MGQRQILSRPSILPSIISILVSERHVKILLEKENAVLVGTAVDELIRHHPVLRDSVFDGVIAVLSKIEDLGNAYEPPEGIRQWYTLLPPKSAASKDDVVMADAAGGSSEILSSPENQQSPKSHENEIVSYIDVTGRVCVFFSIKACI